MFKCCIRCFRTLPHGYSLRLLSSNKRNSVEKLQMYTVEQQHQILFKLHKCVQNNITRSYLNEKRLLSLKLLFEQNPDIKSLEPILTVNGFGPKLLHRICDSILLEQVNDVSLLDIDKNDENGAQKLKFPSRLITPSHISQDVIKSVVSIKMDISDVSWARLQIEEVGLLDSWNLIDLSEWADKKCDVHSIWDMVMALRLEIPDGDIYIMENSNWSNIAKVKKPMKYHIQEAMLTTAICSVFNQIDAGIKPRSDMKNRVYFLHSYTPFRLFDKIVGNERVSAEDIVNNMIDGVPDERHRPIMFTNNTAESYKSLEGHQRNSLCQALLLVVTFAELVLYHNQVASKIIDRTSTTKKNKRS